MYDDDKIIPVDFKEAIRKRPGMFLGNTKSKGIISLISGLIIECTELCEIDELIFTVTIIDNNSFSLKIDSKRDLSPFIQLLAQPVTENGTFFTKVLGAITERLELLNDSIHILFKNGEMVINNSLSVAAAYTNISINFQFDQTIIIDTVVDYHALNEQLSLVAMINRKIEILSVDKTQKLPSQNYFYYPRGIFHVFDSLCKTFYSSPDFKIDYDGFVGANQFQIAIAPLPHWTPQSTIVSFANDVQTVKGGSLVDGIIDGLLLGCKKHCEKNSISNTKFKRKNIADELIIFCSVRGGDFWYGGSFKETLESDLIRKQAKEITVPIILNFLAANKEMAEKFIFRLTL